MLDRLLQNPAIALGVIFFVVVLLLVYFTQREKSAVLRMRSRQRFTPDWSHRGGRGFGGSVRSGGFSPQWNRRSNTARPDFRKAAARAEAEKDKPKEEKG